MTNDGYPIKKMSTRLSPAELFYVSYNTTVMSKGLQSYVRDFLEHMEVEKGRSQLTVRNYDFYLKRFGEWAGYPEPKNITREMVRQYRLWLNRHVEGRDDGAIKKSTQNYHLIALRSFLKYLAKLDIPSLPPEQIELAKQGSRQVEFLETEELERLLAAPLAPS